jgi:DNA-binding transcriptional regulator YiaG
MKIKNYEWNGFGFPVIFAELPAVKIRGELIPDFDLNEVAEPLIQFICTQQKVPFSGTQVKFIRMHLGKSLREFAKFMGVTHQSVMRWEDNGKAPAHIEAHIEIVMRIKILKALGCDVKFISQAVDNVEDVNSFKLSAYKSFKAMTIPDKLINGCFQYK